MYLETLLEEESTIKGKITGALTALKEWFLAKIDQVKEIFSTVKTKISDKFRSIVKGAKASKDVVDGNGNKILSKGDSAEKAKGKIKTILSKIKTEGDKTVASCRKGVKAVGDGAADIATNHKKTVLKCLAGIALGIAAAGAILGAMGRKGGADETLAIGSQARLGAGNGNLLGAGPKERKINDMNKDTIQSEEVDFESLLESMSMDEETEIEDMYLEDTELNEDDSLESLLEEIKNI